MKYILLLGPFLPFGQSFICLEGRVSGCWIARVSKATADWTNTQPGFFDPVAQHGRPVNTDQVSLLVRKRTSWGGEVGNDLEDN